MCPEDSPPLKKLRTDEAIEDKTNLEKNELTLEELENEPGFYQSTMRSMLLPGHEGELCNYLKEMGLIQRSVRCSGSEKQPNCTSPMKWTQARIVDKYVWKCNECTNKCSIRENSFFKLSKCNLMQTIRILLGWCKDMQAEDISTILNMKVHPIKKLYDICAQVIEQYVDWKRNEWRIGGENIIVLIDIYPDVYKKFNNTPPVFQNNNTTSILCFAEIKDIPTQYWFHVLPTQDVNSLLREITDVIKSIVRPGSILVFDSNSYYFLKISSMTEYTITTIEKLSNHDKQDCTILQILDTVWLPALEICHEAQSYPQQFIRKFLYNQLWRRKFAKTPSSALEYILHHIADHYSNSYTLQPITF